MTGAEILTYLQLQGVELWVEGDHLRYRAPKGLMTPLLLSALTSNKQEIVAALRQDNGSDENRQQSLGNNFRYDTSRFAPAGIRARPFSIDARGLSNYDPYTRYVNPYMGYVLSQLDLDKQFVRGDGCFLYDARGVRYLDLVAQYGAVPFGHSPSEIWDALREVEEKGIPNLTQPSTLKSAGELAERLIGLAPSGMRYVTFTNSGSEAIEVAIKLCWTASRRPGILATENSFHGKTLGALSATGRHLYRQPFSAKLPTFHHIPFGDIDALRNALALNKAYFAAFIVEPIQGEGGIVDPPAGYLATASAICKAEGVLLVVDEIQTGLGRTGRLFACQHDGVLPDIITVAKALGGGLVPIGACLCTERVFTREFALYHSSTFAGNTLACQAALASLALLERDEQYIVRQVENNGRRLKERLLQLQNRYPGIIKSVRGKGYMLGIQFDLDSDLCRQGWMSYLADQEVLNYVLASYLLNVEKIRVAPTANAGDVLRIEPPLTLGWDECTLFLEALERLLELLQSGETARLVAHLAGVDESETLLSEERNKTVVHRGRRQANTVAVSPTDQDGRFAFLTYVNAIPGYVDLDPNFGTFSLRQMTRLRKRVSGLLNPATIGEAVIESTAGKRAYGEFIGLPYTPQELIDMPYDHVIEEISWAVGLAKSRGARIVGLGGFTSIVTQGGICLRDAGLSPLTTGNSYTAIAGRRTVELACEKCGKSLSRSTVAIVGAAGSVGRATAILISENVGGLILVGNPGFPERSRNRLMNVAAGILSYLWGLVCRGHIFVDGTLGSELASLDIHVLGAPTPATFISAAEELEKRGGLIRVTTDINECLNQADIVVTATSSVESFIKADHLRRNAIVCELSRPLNVCAEVRTLRPDVSVVEGGLIRIPGAPILGVDMGLEPGMVYACVAETMLLALEHSYKDTSLGVDLDISSVLQIEELGNKHGFSVAY